jgi:uncharacterized protein
MITLCETDLTQVQGLKLMKRMTDILQTALVKARQILADPQIEQSHGFDHALQVLAHSEKMLECESPVLHPEDALSIKLAALLHDVDDRKLFPNNKNYENANYVLQYILNGQDRIHKKVIEMINFVSTSTNGNIIDEKSAHWMLYPRFADRLEAIGPVGVERCLAYTRHLNGPLFFATTPRATTIEELWKIATPERFSNYLMTKSSLSFIDHFYDKLLHIGTLEALGNPTNHYLIEEATKRHLHMVDYIINFGRTGFV